MADWSFTLLTRRLQYLEEIRREFWNKWKAVVFQGLDRSYRWRTECRSMRVGDVVLMKEETAASASYKLGRIVTAIPNPEDKRVRQVVVA